ncbi:MULTISPECIES: phosphoribosylamine--glycine ligase [Vagococcus]|uniref:Phosphoribosylamine--glycine ligase n=1 Tax=Vagococcus fluvialis bH819 TaxID=1255619 RepID=A0A1X8XKZ4_9ENTE|nr:MULTISPECIES: phosphoribosylamine--glycine ligase [Vagococcus]SLM84638.1 Phosphoribosylamine--glycine ligase [Vagococcus fluvialis bH819]HCM89898.1 phosphoribosylamine--glycine ligase [Vagococcus sp.]
MKRKILVIGSGGREHAICKKLLESPKVETVFCAKGNAGMLFDGIEIVDISEDNHDELIVFSKKMAIDWVLVGPEVPLMNGIVDDFKQAGIKIFGPSKAAAMIEGSKEFAKKIMVKYDISTANYQGFSDYAEALEYVKKNKLPIVIKEDGLAAGKGVTIVYTLEEAQTVLKAILGEASSRVVIEEFLIGKEFSLLSFVNETGFYPMVAAKDHKAIFDGDKGLNTGGMGAYSPVDYVTKEVEETVIQDIIQPTIEGMKKEGIPFEGILYTGLILTNEGPKVIEYNARFGDPETQVLLERLDSDFCLVIESLLSQEVPKIIWKKEGTSLGVVVSAKGYPEVYEKGIEIPDFGAEHEVKIIYSGVSQNNDTLVSNGGRVFLVAVTEKSRKIAHKKIYEWLENQDLKKFYYRKDIGNN